MVRRFDLEREEADTMQPNMLNVVFCFQSSCECSLIGVQAWGSLFGVWPGKETCWWSWEGEDEETRGCPPASLGTDGCLL